MSAKKTPEEMAVSVLGGRLSQMFGCGGGGGGDSKPYYVTVVLGDFRLIDEPPKLTDADKALNRAVDANLKKLGIK